VRNFSGHQELPGVFASGVATEIDQSLIDDLGPSFGCDVAAQIDVELAGYLQIVGRPPLSPAASAAAAKPATRPASATKASQKL
jgi:hypothetical protein